MKQLLTGGWDVEQLMLRTPAEVVGLDLDLLLGVTVTGLDLAHRTVMLMDGSEVPYDGLVIATGIRPRRLPGEAAHVLRTLDDALFQEQARWLAAQPNQCGDVRQPASGMRRGARMRRTRWPSAYRAFSRPVPAAARRHVASRPESLNRHRRPAAVPYRRSRPAPGHRLVSAVSAATQLITLGVYPAILPAEGGECEQLMGLAPGDLNFLREKEQQLNTMLRDKARAAGAEYVDTYTPSAGRDACADRDVRWIEPLVPAAPAAPVHPNERGERGMAQAVLRAAGAAG